MDGWRLPSFEEAMSLVSKKKKGGELYINELFNNQQKHIWISDCISYNTSESMENVITPLVLFYTYGGYGYCNNLRYIFPPIKLAYVRAVRTC